MIPTILSYFIERNMDNASFLQCINRDILKNFKETTLADKYTFHPFTDSKFSFIDAASQLKTVHVPRKNVRVYIKDFSKPLSEHMSGK